MLPAWMERRQLNDCVCAQQLLLMSALLGSLMSAAAAGCWCARLSLVACVD
mgnify:CR=1 FL=1